MLKILLALLTFALLCVMAGCDDSKSENQPTEQENDQPPETEVEEDPVSDWISGFPDFMTDEGILVYWDSTEAIDMPEPQEIDRMWIEVLQCVSQELIDNGVDPESTEPPIMRIIDTWDDACPTDAHGVRAIFCPDSPPYAATLPKFAHHVQKWKHEFMHHIFYQHEMTEQYYHKPNRLWHNCQWN